VGTPHPKNQNDLIKFELYPSKLKKIPIQIKSQTSKPELD